MTQIILDASVSSQLHRLTQMVELCDPTGQVIGRFVPLIDLSEWEPLSPDVSEEELDRRAQSKENRYTTTEVLAHLESDGLPRRDIPEEIMETNHLGGDILADRRLTEEELRAALCSLLSVSPEKIFIYRDYEELLEETGKAEVYCRFYHLQGGEFHTVIDLPCNLLHDLPRNSIASRFAMLLGSRLLIDDGSINPFAYLLYDDKGNFQPVSIDADADDKNEIVIYRG